MKRALGRFAACLFGGLLALPLPAADLTATVASVTGKVQVQKGTDWLPVTVGQTLALGSTVSTGFRSELKLKIGPSVVAVKPLSRLTILSLVQSGTTATTDLNLRVGKISAEVNKSETVQTQTFTVKSPVATASVRGTEFTFDGVRLEVLRGIVDFVDRNGITVPVPKGEAARAAEPGSSEGTKTFRDLVAEASVTLSKAGSEWGTAGPEDLGGTTLGGLTAEERRRLVELINWIKRLPNTYVAVGGLEP